MTLIEFNKLEKEVAFKELMKCCGSFKWASLMIKNFPFESEKDILSKASQIWNEECRKEDWLEAFMHHPKIGDLKSLEKKFAATKEWTGAEQAGVKKTNEKIIKELAKGNNNYEEKFHLIFIVCATGKSAEEMLRLLEDRLQNNYEDELLISMNEQNKITQIRLQKLIT
ncbi:MAG: 2-oxo-4-hydroxy-4-carboxy-5-ureidoimidazoline decarboxylase [Bacteroidota bacterium]|nr:2-oxo-4-hydroxy-4-carboxy-5-ureidoimidazoline decarboxylase [Bacteroidota bacterium]